jgi:hypothetical protein
MVNDCAKAIVDFFVSAYKDTVKFFTDMYHDTVKWAEDTYHSFVKFCEDSYHAIINFFTKLPGEAERWFAEFNMKIARWIVQTYHDVVNWVEKTYHDVVNWLNNFPGSAEKSISDMYHSAMSWIERMYHDAVNWFSDIYNDVTGWLDKLPNKIGEILDNCIKAFKDVVSDAFNAAKDFASGLWDGFKKGLGINSPSLIEKQMWQITKVTDVETKRLAGHVRQMRVLAGEMHRSNPAKAAADANTARIRTMTTSMVQQAKLLQNAASALLPSAKALGFGLTASSTLNGAPAMPSGTAPEASPSGRAINITVNNPVAERASDSAARKLRTLTAMGAF